MPQFWSKNYMKIRIGLLLSSLLLSAIPLASMAQIGVGISVNVAPPELPVYEQPAIPEDGYMWTPGYWSYDNGFGDYYWVPGTWVPVPQPGLLWTPGYWGFAGGAYVFNGGYWGQTIGFYGGVNYGFGYGGSGFEGGYWQGGHLFYNRSVTNIGTVNVTNVYNKTVINNVTVTKVSYNGGTGGISARPTAAEQAAAHEPHLAPIAAQRTQETTARSNPALRASNNQGKPPIAATARPGAFTGAGVVAATKGGTVSKVRPNPAAAHGTAPAAHAAPPAAHTTAPAHTAPPAAHTTPPAHTAPPATHAAPPVTHAAPPAEHEPAR